MPKTRLGRGNPRTITCAEACGGGRPAGRAAHRGRQGRARM